MSVLDPLVGRGRGHPIAVVSSSPLPETAESPPSFANGDPRQPVRRVPLKMPDRPTRPRLLDLPGDLAP